MSPLMSSLGSVGLMISSITASRMSLSSISGACCVETTTVSMALGLPFSYLIVTCDLASGRNHGKRPSLRSCD